MEEIFEKVLDDNEKVVKVFKPNRKKFNWSCFLGTSLVLIWFVLIAILAILIPEEGNTVRPILILIPIGGFVVCEAIILLFANLYYKNLYYAYTNKRLIIRSGIFGVDFRSLDMGMIGAIDVYVSVLDKILNIDTGTICFGSTASPMIAVKGGSYYRFSHINVPYESCKEIKSAIDNFKRKDNSNENQSTPEIQEVKQEKVDNETADSNLKTEE